MELYAQVLNYAIPVFVGLIFLEFFVGRLRGVITIRSMDTVASLSSGMTNIIKDVLGLTVIIFSYTWLEEKVALFDWEPVWWMFILALIGLDFAGYWQHRFTHRINILWNEHIIHHSSEEFNLSCALRQTVSKIFAIYTLLLLPCALLGVPPKIVMIVAPLHLFAQFWYHTRLIGRMGFLEKIIVTPSHHRVHHAINDVYIDKNFSQIFIIWDKLFGTFQEELPEVTPVYGVKRPVNTWNPILINFTHLGVLAQDAWRTRSWWDKFRIWFMPTGWRPADVREKYPLAVIEVPETQQKYDTKPSRLMIIWAWVQLFCTLGLMLILFNTLGKLEYSEMLQYGLFLGTSIFAYTSLMDRSQHAWWMSIICAGMGFFLMYRMDGWFFIDNWFPAGNAVMIVYLALTVVMAVGITFFEFRVAEPKGLGTDSGGLPEY